MNTALPGVARANRMLTALWRAGAPEPLLDADAFEEAAFGGPVAVEPGESDWRTALRRLVDALRDEAALNPLGRTIAHGLIGHNLRARRRARRLWRTHPEILQRPVRAPVIVLGSMRSGTTRIQRLLACDPRFAHTRLFETLAPVPPARRWDHRPLAARAGLAMIKRLNPALGAIHPTAPQDPEEEFGLFNFSFGSAQFEAQWHVPSFARWWEEADTRPAYAEFRGLLQTIAWHRGDPRDRTWVLKAPQFMQDLDSLLATFPDARLICLDRNIDEVVASSASLVWNQMRIQSDQADPSAIGREWERKTRLRLDRAAAVRSAHPRVPQIDVRFEDVNQDWRGEVRRIYDFLGLDLPPPVESRMERYLERARAHLGHRYKAADFGLGPAALSNRHHS